ncbi:hypothetical protein [Aulosira sp. FACHB-615]|uniref:hypothetical protein n=1 Tax=Aulosira sp. FACHB-615 TaxID=2692777 RepID=UPI001682B46C|nr:hypothetical protein [Aulosira sp. FACHB-615]
MTTITPADLQQVVDTYNPEHFRAPLIVSQSIGHDIGSYTDKTASKSKELCHGIPKQLRLAGDRLMAGFEKVSKDFAQWVRDKQIHSVSSSFYLPNSPNNPYSGKWSLRHIAGLGTTPPACKGLAALPDPPPEWMEVGSREWGAGVFEPYAISFNEQEEGVIDFMGVMIASSPWMIAADLFQRQREYLIESESLEVADRVLPADQIAALRSMAEMDSDKSRQIYELQMRIAQLEREELSEYGEGMKKTKPMDDEEEMMEDDEEDMEGEEYLSKKKKKSMDMSEQEQALADREKALRLREEAFERQQVNSFVEGLVNQGKVLAAKKADTITLLLNTPNTANIDFSEDVGSKTPRQALMDMLNDQPSWNYGEAIAPNFTDPVSPHNQSFALPGASAESVKQDTAIRAWCKQNGKDPSDAHNYSEAATALGFTY